MNVKVKPSKPSEVVTVKEEESKLNTFVFLSSSQRSLN